jgi:hypothetical protein
MARVRLQVLALLWAFGCGAGNSGNATTPEVGVVSGGAGAGSTEPPPGNQPADPGVPGGAMVSTCQVFPRDNAWNQDISTLPLHPKSDTFVNSIGRDAHVHPDFGTEWEGAPIGIPFVTVNRSQARLPVEFMAYGDESDPGPYPIPLNAPIEGGADSDGDRHVIAVDTDACQLYELYRAFPAPDGQGWRADSGATFDLTRNDEHPLSWTSADAAGLPLLAGLVRYDEIARGELRHAVRFTVQRTQRGLVPPARHYASNSDDPNLPPMGLRLRMKASYDCSGYSTPARVICDGLKRYGILLADNGSNWYLSGAPDRRWDDDALSDLKQITGNAFEVVDTGSVETY